VDIKKVRLKGYYVEICNDRFLPHSYLFIFHKNQPISAFLYEFPKFIEAWELASLVYAWECLPMAQPLDDESTLPIDYENLMILSEDPF
jgi:hypothetical protein